MPVTVELLDGYDDIFIYHFIAIWTWDDVHNAFNEQKGMIQNNDSRVDNIIDFSDSKKIPDGALTHIRSVFRTRPQNIHLGVFITSNAFVRTIINMARRLNSNVNEKYRVASTLEEALEMIAESRAKDASV